MKFKVVYKESCPGWKDCITSHFTTNDKNLAQAKANVRNWAQVRSRDGRKITIISIEKA